MGESGVHRGKNRFESYVEKTSRGVVDFRGVT